MVQFEDVSNIHISISGKLTQQLSTTCKCAPMETFDRSQTLNLIKRLVQTENTNQTASQWALGLHCKFDVKRPVLLIQLKKEQAHS